MGGLRRRLGLMRSLLVYWRPGRQRALRHLYAPFVVPGDLVFDVGAHLGDRTAAFQGLGARVVAVEPHPELVPWLRRMVGRRAGVTIRPEAVGREPGTARLALSDATPTLSTLADGWRERVVRENPTFRRARWDRFVEVPVTTLDVLIDRHGEPSFCKIDIEGHEAAALAGLSRPLEALSVEFVAGGLSVAEECVRRLNALGSYEFNAVRGERRSFEMPVWIGAPEMVDWLRSGADGVSSGDLYARLTTDAARPPPPGRAHRPLDGEDRE
jgi:FkbM family methyltransferase